MSIHHDSENVWKKLNGYLPLKPGLVRSPAMYLVTNLMHKQLLNGIWTWSLSPPRYVQEAVRICKEYVAKHLSKSYRLPKRADNPFKSSCCPELDVSLVLEPDEASLYQSLIGVMC